MDANSSTPSNIILTALLVFRRIKLHKNLNKLVISYLYETVHLDNPNRAYQVINGIKHGKSLVWYENGQLQYETDYKNGQIDGKSRAWYENGQLSYETDYKNGKIDGKSLVWRENGQLTYEKDYTNGQKDGKYLGWYDNGQGWHENGQIK